MSLDLVIRQKLSCPNHPRYNPESGGEGAIRGGCKICTKLFALWKKSVSLNGELQTLGEEIIATRQAAKA